ncbi:ABC transporter permease [Blastococcus sp. TF02A-30]|uniref:ABC transporter permease n=1 Tax=Blastococcus sp. TF02A-30 TaxID=2250580 RepID=UPI000DE963BF|nr:ABC transporter permease [Blastococcus sp. TF02A-30]RBY86439.1 ABC transporter permease [Blastococcus sp. TF02A-30]
MIRLVRAELTKLFTTKVWLGLLLGAVVMVAAFAVFFTAFAGDPESGIPEVGTAAYDDLALSTAANANILFLILGIIGMTQEYRHRTATPTFLTTPKRGQVVIAKLIAYALAGAAFALVVVVVNYVVVAIHAGALGSAPALNADNVETMASSWLALIIYSVIGVGLGALLRNQVGAIVGGLVYLFVVEPIIRSVPATAGAYKWMPGGALEALTATFEGPELLQAWQGGLLLLGYGLVAALLGTLLAVRRDVV